ncbi:MAG: hypothetical protein HQ509_11760 [Candidatus Marinimicrobia bacterium]|nr:hypothetical protein [Candidatus Neomarinimicrobiota bacterium]
MKKIIICVFILFWTCGPKPEPKPEIQPIIPKLEETIGDNTALTQGLMTPYDVYLFLKDSPSEKEIIYTFGYPDSTWLDEEGQVKVWYYFLEEVQDYNSIELDPVTGKVIGFEWD